MSPDPIGPAEPSSAEPKPSSPAEVLVAVPARDEAATIADCLAHLHRAARHAWASGHVLRVRVAVAAHRCSDATAEIAAAHLAELSQGTALSASAPARSSSVRSAAAPAPAPHAAPADAAGQLRLFDGFVRPVAYEATVGQVRTELIAAAIAAEPALDPARLWVFSTDADSVVPHDWISETLAAAHRAQADLVAGMTEVSGWEADRQARSAYAALIEAGMTGSGHRHVYAANLAVRYAAYLRAGGFPPVLHGEERALLNAVQAQGGRVLSTLQPLVTTSGRMPGRAEQGLGALLASIAATGKVPAVDPPEAGSVPSNVA